MNIKSIYGWATALLLILNITSCEKKEVEMGIVPFGEVYFNSDQSASYTAGTLKIKYNGYPIQMDQGTGGRIRVPEGEGNFEFYDESTGKILGEKAVNIVAGSPESYKLFQPTENDPVAVLDPNGQADEEAAPNGFIKLKIANYAGDLLPNDLDIVVLGLNMNLETVELAILENVSNNLGEEEYRRVPTGGSDILAYTFKFRNRKTQQIVKNHGGEDYWNQNLFIYPESISPFPEKRVYTVYLQAYEQWGENPSFIRSGDKYYEIGPEILYAD